MFSQSLSFVVVFVYLQEQSNVHVYHHDWAAMQVICFYLIVSPLFMSSFFIVIYLVSHNIVGILWP